ncbi:Hydrolase pyvD-like protein [Cladobotryum mycophilum]|uniref:Hydrolase pyvD-like protein n=1 Tax=Cladobotryum mycophilum TaxID=491253 RepID=A0ABR0T1S9_9HYPO
MSCPDCFTGELHEGDPRGTITKAYGLDAYVTEPSNGEPAKGIIIMIPDAFGWEFVNLRLLADKYADKGGYKVYLPDFMDGHSAPLSMLETMKTLNSSTGILSKIYYGFLAAYDAIPWFIRNNPGKAMPRVKGFFEQLRKEEGETLPIGTAGFCWGGKYVVLLAQGLEINGKPLIDAGFTGHPSLLSVPGDIQKITRPLSIAIGDKDSVLSVPQAQKVKGILEGNEGPAKGRFASTRMPAMGSAFVRTLIARILRGKLPSRMISVLTGSEATSLLFDHCIHVGCALFWKVSDDIRVIKTELERL